MNKISKAYLYYSSHFILSYVFLPQSNILPLLIVCFFFSKLLTYYKSIQASSCSISIVFK